MEGLKMNQSIDKIMELFNIILKGYGIESIERMGETICYYVNIGESYEKTILYDCANDEFIHCSWGGFLEEWEQRHCEDNSLIQCGYCGDFHPLEDGKDWRDIICSFNSKYCVDGSYAKELEESKND
jgi:hypothetical protein